MRHCPTIKIVGIEVLKVGGFFIGILEISHIFIISDAYLWTAWVIPPQIPLLNINNISGSVRRSNLMPVFFTQAFQANPGAI